MIFDTLAQEFNTPHSFGNWNDGFHVYTWNDTVLCHIGNDGSQEILEIMAG